MSTQEGMSTERISEEPEAKQPAVDTDDGTDGIETESFEIIDGCGTGHPRRSPEWCSVMFEYKNGEPLRRLEVGEVYGGKVLPERDNDERYNWVEITVVPKDRKDLEAELPFYLAQQFTPYQQILRKYDDQEAQRQEA